ncbi:MAG TPA: DUF4349 domain-containing protein [Candidatus Limnocylindria bacterium]|nr:DUF4349 domain-containing protein [Candidatus Limnocylindria bacterium]
MSTTRWAGRRPALLMALLLVAVLAACAAGAGGAPAFQDAGDEGAGAGGAPAELDGGDRAGGGEGEEEPGGGLFAPIEQRIVKTGEITLEVENVGEMIGRVRAMATTLNGYVGGSQAGTLDDRATLTLRIPADRFDEALAELHAMDADVVAEATREQDVTGQVVDLQARIDNLEASERSYRELVARATDVDDILAVQTRLDQVRGEIEQLTAQLEQIEGQAALSTLTVTLVPSAEPVTEQTEAWDPGKQLERALASLVGIGQGLFDGLIWFAVVWLPILLILSLLVLVALRAVLEVRRRMPPSAPRTGDEAA